MFPYTYKALFMRAFFQCKECDFVFTTLGQANYMIEGSCPSCGEYELDYASESKRKDFIEGVKNELESFEREIANE